LNEMQSKPPRRSASALLGALVVAAVTLAACGAQPPQSTPTVEAVESVLTGEPVSGGATFQISPDESEVRFVIDEVLGGQPKTVVGTTKSVSGEVVADYADTSGAQVSTLSVDLSTLATDNDFRNRALHDFILETGNPDFQFAEFVSTSVSGLPDSFTVGETYPFQISGDLTIHGVTQAVTFDASVTPVSETRLEGSASTTVKYADFGVQILQLPAQVASVEDTVSLEIDFVAVAQ
jgi:polyisoprenoid-binding protein YceI